MKLDRTYQLNTGGNTDFLNMLNRTRLASKKESKTEAVQSVAAERLPDDDIHVGPVRLRALAERQQGLLPAHGGAPVRRRADEPRAAPLGRGLAELRRRLDRRRALREARARPRHRRRARRPVLVLHEAPAAPGDRRAGLRGGRRRSSRRSDEADDEVRSRRRRWPPRASWRARRSRRARTCSGRSITCRRPATTSSRTRGRTSTASKPSTSVEQAIEHVRKGLDEARKKDQKDYRQEEKKDEKSVQQQQQDLEKSQQTDASRRSRRRPRIERARAAALPRARRLVAAALAARGVPRDGDVLPRAARGGLRHAAAHAARAGLGRRQPRLAPEGAASRSRWSTARRRCSR